jgi:hypothetical protein
MKSRFALALLAAAATLWGAEFWDAKPFTEWSEKEVNKIMGDSPWAKTATSAVDMNKLRDMPMAQGGGEDTPPSAGAGGRGGRGGRGGGGGGGGLPPMMELMVRWHSAMTVRQAIVRGQFGDKAGTAPEAAEFLARPFNQYVLAVTRLPMRYFQRVDPKELQKMLAESVTLHLKGAEPLKPNDIQFQSNQQSLTIFFAFPRDRQISLDDKEVEFQAEIGPLKLKRKFKLADMVRDGKLDL